MRGGQGDLPESVTRPELIQKDDRHSGSLYDRVRWSDARHAARLAEERRVHFAFVLRQVLHFRLELRLVRRLIGIGIRLLGVSPISTLDERIALAELAVDRRIGPAADCPVP